VTEREDERTVREKLGNAARACSDDVTGWELIKNKSNTTNVLFASTVRDRGRREKTSRYGVQEKKNHKELTGIQTNAFFYTWQQIVQCRHNLALKIIPNKEQCRNLTIHPICEFRRGFENVPY